MTSAELFRELPKAFLARFLNALRPDATAEHRDFNFGQFIRSNIQFPSN